MRAITKARRLSALCLSDFTDTAIRQRLAVVKFLGASCLKTAWETPQGVSEYVMAVGTGAVP
jgi:hypothetical protein